MNNEEKNINETNVDAPGTEPALPTEDVSKAPSNATDSLADDIIRNDTIPETSKDTPGSSGAFPVGAFENIKD